MHILLTDPSGSKKLVNMALVSEALAATGTAPFTNLVIPSATIETNSLIPVRETPEQIGKMLRALRAGRNPNSSNES